MNRRNLLAGIGSAGIVGLSGCLGVIGFDKHSASPVGVASETRSDTEYSQTDVDELSISESVGAVGYSEEIVVDNYLTEHEKDVDMGPLGEQRGAVFVVLSTPQISIVGQQVNPVEDKSTEELVELVAGNYGGIDSADHESDGEISLLGETTTESTFVADAEFDGQDVEVNLHITEAVETADDMVVAIGVYPRDLENQERDNIRALIEGVSENVDVEDNGDEGDDTDDSDQEDDDEGEDDDDTEQDEEDDNDDEEDDEIGV